MIRFSPFKVSSVAFAVHCCFSGAALAYELPLDLVERSPALPPALTVSGPSGGLTVPDGRVVADGTAAWAFNNYQDPRFFRARHHENYLFALGILPHIELSGRLANYSDPRPGQGRGFTRDLSANIKVAVPKLFDGQPDIAFGMTDLGGGAVNFRSRYISASERIGPLNVTAGVARGAPALDGLFVSAEYAIGNTGLSLLAERNSGVNSAGLRYASAPIAMLANAQLVATAQRTLGAERPDGGRFDRPALGIAIAIPFGGNASAATVLASTPASTSGAPAVTTYAAAPPDAPSSVQVIVSGAGSQASGTPPAPDLSNIASLGQLQAALESAGLERVRVGKQGSRLVIEYENHRYNQNEVDAIGIALGLGARLAPEDIKRIRVITKKSGLALYETSVDRAGFRNFLADGDPYQVIAGLQSQFRPKEDADIAWFDRQEGRRGYSRVVIRPLLNYFVGTEVGVFDYGLGVNAQLIVPLWKGAEASVNVVRDVAVSDNVRNNGIFNYGRHRDGVQSAVLSQAFWLHDQVLNVTTVGKLAYDFAGVQNETTFFVPGRDDQFRLQYSRLRKSEPFFRETRVNAGAFYRYSFQPLDLIIEAGYSQYVGNDRGPSLSFSRWFGDVEAQAYIRRSDQQITFAGFQLAFPLTPRRGMRAGITHVEGPARFGLALETKLAGRGGDNRITRGVAEAIPFAYSPRNQLFNRGRVGEDYMLSQLPRMRDAALRFSPHH